MAQKLLTSEERYYKLSNFLLASLKFLHETFESRWKIETGTHWCYHEPQGRHFIEKYVGEDVYSSLTSSQQVKMLTGNLDEWDHHIFCVAFQTFDDPSYSKGNLAVHQIFTIKSELDSQPSKTLTVDDLNDKVIALHTAFSALYISKFDTQKLMDAAGVTCPYQAWKIALEIIRPINDLLNSPNPEQVFPIYTQALGIPGLLPSHVTEILELKLACYLRLIKPNGSHTPLYFIQFMLDTVQSLEYNPLSWKSHFIAAKLHQSLFDYPDAFSHYEAALKIRPGAVTVSIEYDACKEEAAAYEANDPLIALTKPVTLSERIANCEKTIGAFISQERFIRVNTSSGDLGHDEVFRGHMYANGWTVPQNYEMAAHHYEQAADLGSAEAKYHLGLCYFYGRGKPQNDGEALMKFHEVSKLPPDSKGEQTLVTRRNLGVALAQCAMGFVYQKGLLGMPSDIKMAVEMYRMSIHNGVPLAARRLAQIFFKGCPEFPPDENAVSKCWEQGAQLGDSVAVTLLLEFSIRHLELHLANLAYKIAKSMDANFHALCDITFERSINSVKIERKKYEEDVEAFEKNFNLGSNELTFLQRIMRMLRFELCDTHLEPHTLNSHVWPRNFHRVNIPNPYRHVSRQQLLKNFTTPLSPAAGRILDSIDRSKSLNELLKKYVVGSINEINVIDLFYSAATEDPYTKIVEPSLVPGLKSIIVQMFNNLMLGHVSGNEDHLMKLRYCYVAIQLQERTLPVAGDTTGIKVLQDGLKMYPNNVHYYRLLSNWYGSVQQYLRGLEVAEQGLEKFPNDPELLYTRAEHIHMSDESSLNDGIVAFETFLMVAPMDHECRPEAYFSMAHWSLLNMQEGESLRQIVSFYYRQGLKAEELQLSCYLPYNKTPSRRIAQVYIREFVGERIDLDLLTEALHISDDNKEKENAKTALILEHRSNMRKMANNPEADMSEIHGGTKRSKMKILTPSQKDMVKVIRLNEMTVTKDRIFMGCCLSLTIIDDPIWGFDPVHVIAQDDNGDLARVYVYNVKETPEKKLKFGSKIKLVDPYVRVGKLVGKAKAIRIDNLNDVVQLEVVEYMCRFCGRIGANLLCGKCLKVKYCGKGCQEKDWKLRKHKSVCGVGVNVVVNH